VTLAAILIIINVGLFCISFLPLAQYNYKHSSGADTIWKTCSQLRKMQLLRRT